ncbi:MarR family winged helix-turn-helix transcriptional regulator [Cohnella soli]|uniref:MarR family winged helix-turn-helix transcriptional regulator n=1 Tax=Cohnella soli TaxID=425005 RepID=A0ABW0HQV2_9BACL
MMDIREYVDNQPPKVRAFFAMVDATAHLIGLSEKYWASQGLNGARIRILVEIAKAGGTILPSVLAGRIGVTKANISVLLVPLEQLGFIRISEHPEDGRKRRVELTGEGEAILLEKLPGNRDTISTGMSSLNEAETEQLWHLLSKLHRSRE